MIKTLQLNLMSNFETHSTKTKILHEKLYFGIQVSKAYRKKKTFSLPIFVAFVIFKVYIYMYISICICVYNIYIYIYIYILYICICILFNYLYIYIYIYTYVLHKNIKQCPAHYNQDQVGRTQIFIELK